jgi:alpha-L-fucosidase
LYAHIFEENIGPINLQGLSNKVKQIRLLSDGSEILISKPWNATEYPNDLFCNFGTPEHNTYPLPDEIDTVLELELNSII